MSAPDTVRLVEVGPRDGLQNEARSLPAAVKVAFIEQLIAAGLRHIEVGAFVAAARVPQMADSGEVVRHLRQHEGVRYAALVPNVRGFAAAVDAGVGEVAVFASASETFSQRNIGCSIEESFTRFELVLEAARAAGVRVRGYVSCILGCPFEGAVAPAAVARVAQRLNGMGCYEVSLGDTIGVGTPGSLRAMLQAVKDAVPVTALAGHFHDTYGQALVNVYAAMESGVRVFDASVSGLGGCPYAPGASGNLATEDLVYMLDGMGIATGVAIGQLLAAGEFICGELGVRAQSRVARAMALPRAKPL